MEFMMSIESAAVAIVLTAVLGGLAASLSRLRPVLVTAIAIVAGVILAWTAASSRVVPVTEEEVTYRPIEVPDEAFVSSETCRSCHPREYDTWHGSYHRTMTQVAVQGSIVGEFDGVELELHGTSYRLERDESFHWIEFEAVRRPVVMTTGSHTVQAYWYPTGDRRNLEMFPFVYYIPEKRWMPRESIFVRPPPDQRNHSLPEERKSWPDGQRWNHTCIQCHTTRPQPKFAELDTRAAEFGIACEACHGPGGEHVRRHRDPRQRYAAHLAGEGDDSIVDPRSLDHRRSSQVCAICHGISHPKSFEELKHDLDGGRRFRPGDELADTRLIVQPSQGLEHLRGFPDHDPRTREQSFWADGMVRVKGRDYNGLIDSPCYQRGELSCFSCHVMHQSDDDPRPLAEWANDQLDAGMDGDRACVQCHEELGGEAQLVAHSRHEPASSGSRCYNCHMPHTTYGLLKAIRSHQIDSPSALASLETGRPNACNQCHLDKTLDWTAEHLEEWYGIEPPEMDEISQSVPASLIWLLSGDAAQRALMAWSMGWEPAREASGTFWMTPFLAQLLVDPYDAVRFNAGESIALQRGFESFEYDFLAPPEKRQAAHECARAWWQDMDPPEDQIADAAELVVTGDPESMRNVFLRLLAARNDRVVSLAE